MHIAFVEPHLDIYGGIRRVLEFSNRFVARGERVTIYHPAGTPCSWMRCDAEVRATRDILDTAHDVLIFNNPPDYPIARRAAATLKVFYILELYDKDQLTRFTPKILWPRKGRMMSLKRSLQMPYLRVCNATWMQTWLRENLHMETRLQFGGIDRSVFRPVETERDGDAFRILCSGDPRGHKGTATVHAAMERVRAAHPEVTLESYHARGIPQSEMAACYSRADLFVDAQRHAGWNNPVIEAMACGTPVVCTDIGGVADFAFAGETALLVPPDDPVALADAILRAIADAALRARLVDAALGVVERFDWDRATDSFLDMLRGELAAAGVGRS